MPRSKRIERAITCPYCGGKFKKKFVPRPEGEPYGRAHCSICGEVFIKRGPNQLICNKPECKFERDKLKQERYKVRWGLDKISIKTRREIMKG